MSRKNKTLRAFLHQNPEATIQEAWDAAWNAHGTHWYTLHVQELDAEIQRLQARLERVADVLYWLDGYAFMGKDAISAAGVISERLHEALEQP